MQSTPSTPRLVPRVVLLAFLLFAPPAATASGDGDPPWSPGEEPETTSFSRVWARVESFTWREYDGGRRLLEETGPRYAVGVNRVFTREAIVFTPSFEVLYGEVDYDGHTQAGAPVSTEVRYSGFTLALELANAARLAGGGVLEPHLSLGWEYRRRDLRSTDTADGYVENWNSFDARGGLRGEFPLGGGGDGPRLLADGGVAWPVATTNSVDFPGLPEEVTVHPKGQPWPYAEVGLSWRAFRGIVSYRGYRFDPSDPVDIGGGYALSQPESKGDVYSFTVAASF
jgi:hypothetical protein